MYCFELHFKGKKTKNNSYMYNFVFIFSKISKIVSIHHSVCEIEKYFKNHECKNEHNLSRE